MTFLTGMETVVELLDASLKHRVHDLPNRDGNRDAFVTVTSLLRWFMTFLTGMETFRMVSQGLVAFNRS